MEESKLIGKRINFTPKNIQRIEILSAILKQELEGKSNRESFDYIVNKVIEEFYKSDKIKKLLDI
ncbi:MAG: hypothetical protein KBE02_06255 [Sulfurospirillum sp.]|nr:hypothetical protein [Sulfurospirillum sp.]MBV5278844.1 hypothetical protein [Campylobacteraceae bacterium]